VQVTKLENITHNVHEICGNKVERIQADMDRDVYKFFFHHVLAGNWGCRQAMINFFFQRLFEACLEQGIKPVWEDVDTNGQRVVDLLNRMNFNGQPVST
jgi:hypothetical protein